MMLVSLISYVDRNTLALLSPTILKETHLSAEEYGWIISAFSVVYMLANPLWGRLIDRLGLALGMTLAVSFWTLASASHALASGFWTFALARAALGLGEGATFPGGLRAVTQSLRVTEQARGIALAYSGGSLGALVTPLIITPVFLWWGWRAAFLFTGLIGAAWLLMWFFIARREDVRRAPETFASPGDQPPALRFTDKRVWGLILSYALGALPLGFVLYSAALFLHNHLGASQETIGKVLWIPPLGWEVGYFCWAWTLDRMSKRGIPRAVAVNRLMLIAGVLSLPLAVVPSLDNFWLVMALMFFAMFMTVGFVIPTVSHAVNLYTTAHSGLIAGIGAGAYGAGVALFSPLFGRLFDQRRYDIAFLIAALMPLLGYAAWRWINRAEIARVTSPSSLESAIR